MRTLLLALVLSSSVVCAAKPLSSYTGEWILLKAPSVQGREHAVRVAGVTFAHRVGDRVEFDAPTYDDGEWGGWVRLVVPETRAKETQRRFGSLLKRNGDSVRTRRFDGIVHVDHETSTVYLVDREAWESMQADLRAALGTGVRTWTSAEGATIQAELVRATGETVTIRRHPDRTEFTIPLTRLAKDDQDYVKSYVNRSTAGAAHPE